MTRTYGMDMKLWYGQGLMVKTKIIDNNHGIDLESWYTIGTPESHSNLLDLKVPFEIDSWYRHGLMVLKTPIVLT